MLEGLATTLSAVIKAGIPFYIAAFFFAGLLLFVPQSVADIIGVDELRQSYRGYLGVVFLSSASLLLGRAAVSMGHVVTNTLDDKRLRRLTLGTLKMLTAEEKFFLTPFVKDGQNTRSAPLSDGVSGGLVAKKIIYRSSNIIHGFSAPYNLQPIARILLSENPDLLE